MKAISTADRIKYVLRAIVLSLPGGTAFLQRRAERIFQRLSAEEVFTNQYGRETWNNEETVCGPGSTINNTENIRREIPKLIEQLNVKRFLDAPCGDYNWFQLIVRPEHVHYIGGDIVSALVERNQQRYQNNNTTFIKLDITQGPLPNADLWMCRDCLFHLSSENVFKALQNFINSGTQYLLTSTHLSSPSNREIPTGSFHFLNLEKSPYNFCSAILYIDDPLEGQPVRQMGLWNRDMVFDALANRSNQA
jgi:SAM-dependent methyltransferase